MKSKFLLFCLGSVLILGGYCFMITKSFTEFAYAADGDLPGSDTPCGISDSWTYCNPLYGTVHSIFGAGKVIVQYLLGLIGTIALFFLVYAGVVYITAAGNEEKITNAKKIITGTVIGLGIALLTYSLLTTIMTILKVK
jgi:hypothetical protein